MAWYNPLTWGDKIATDVLDKDDGILVKAGEWIGNQDFTEEDRAEHNASIAKGVTSFAVSTLNENTIRSKARREIAYLWIKSQLSLILMCAITAPFDDELYSRYIKIALSDVMTYGTAAIFIFFFGSYGIARYNETKK